LRTARLSFLPNDSIQNYRAPCKAQLQKLKEVQFRVVWAVLNDRNNQVKKSNFKENVVNKIISEIEEHIKKCGGGYSAWYCGIASKPKDRLFEDHNVNEKSGAWIYRDATTDTAARTIEDYFLKKGCKGGDGGGDRQSKYVYAYKITSTTKQ